MTFDQRPETIRTGVVERAVGHPNVPPSRVIPKISHGPIIQPISLTQYRLAGVDVEAVRHVLCRLDR